MTEYEYEYYSVWKNHPNTNTNIIRFEKITWIRIRILFDLKKSREYEYEYYSVWKYQLNTNTNILVFEYYSNNIRIPNYLLTSVHVTWNTKGSISSDILEKQFWRHYVEKNFRKWTLKNEDLSIEWLCCHLLEIRQGKRPRNITSILLPSIKKQKISCSLINHA